MPKCRTEIQALIQLNELEAELRLAVLDTLAPIDEAEPETLAQIANVEALIAAERAKPTGDGKPRRPRPVNPEP
jgi:hypothetical protein